MNIHRTFFTLLLTLVVSIASCQNIEAAEAKLVFNTDDVIWGFDFLDNNTALFTEKQGKLGIVTLSTGSVSYIEHTIPSNAHGQGGLLDIYIVPPAGIPSDQTTGENEQLIFITYTKQLENGEHTTALSRGTLSGNRKKLNSEEILVTNASGNGGIHFGSRLSVDLENRHIYMSVGERGNRDEAQSLATHNGTVLRINYDGTPVKSNPFTGRSKARPEIFTYGHRNPQGLYFTKNNHLYETEFGPKGGDEINLIEKGNNYGWPKATYGREYSGAFLAPDTAPGTTQPIAHYEPAISPSGMMIYEADYHSSWRGDMFIANLSSRHLRRVRIQDGTVTEEEELFNNMNKRIRHVNYSPEGRIYFSTDSGELYLIEK